jgi:hypothetical protein
VIATTPEVDRHELERRTGWKLEPQGACKGDVCVPLPGRLLEGDTVDLETLAPLMGMPLLHDEEHDVWVLGPESGGRALATAELPDLVFPDVRTGEPLALRSLRGRRFVLAAWASW